ncbi:hypothetical protein ACRALDRAFT_2099058 [Sodiomyces alcalophilus JCM 7366]|uniref:uncharacterized protein n=1 Tax=Sodiomyces alcalophilus JCM 7366 TaxID=591952 RepID=UPI0039B5A307
MASRNGGVEFAPPPSTLAAQLVENISASTRTSRSDDNAELRRLSATIQQVESNPGLLKTPDDQLRHNHLLTYVFIRAVLGGLRINDPFADRSHLRSEVLRAISFLKLIVQETPAVLQYTDTSEHQFELRGDEPLWVWVFPKLLRLLGHAQFLELSPDIEGFFQEVLALLAPSQTLQNTLSAIVAYFREISDALLLQLRDLLPPSPIARDVPLHVTLPDDNTLVLVIGKNAVHSTKQSTYTIAKTSQAIRQVFSLLTILARPLMSQHNLVGSSVLSTHMPWLLDSLLSLRSIRLIWKDLVPANQIQILQTTLSLLSPQSLGSNVIAQRKAYTLLGLHCADMVHQHHELTAIDQAQAEPARKAFCNALLHLADAALRDRSISSLIVSKILNPLRALMLHSPQLGELADFRQSVQVLMQTSGVAPPNELTSDTQPASFTDPDLRRQVEALQLVPQAESEPASELPAKRRKISSEVAELPESLAIIYKTLGLDPDAAGLTLTALSESFVSLPGKSTAKDGIRTLAVFMRRSTATGIEQTVTDRNRKNALSLLKGISDQNVTGISETNIMAWGQLGRIVVGDELNLVLHKLLGYLGGSNSLISSCAFSEIVNLAASRRVSCRQLFEPFWGNLAFFAIKDMVSRPQISRALAELLQISVNQLLLHVQSYALPWLVLMKKKDVVQKIVDARQEKDPISVLMDSDNNGPIMALLLIQDVTDIEEFVMSRLREFASHFESCTLTGLMQPEALSIVLELLKAAGDAGNDKDKKPRIINALTWMCTQLMTASGELKARSKKQSSNVVGRFLESYLLGLMSRLVDVINDRQLRSPPVEEQRRCLRAMEEMINVCRAYVRIARPQISACLLSALTHDDLRSAAFSCWAALLTKLEDEDVEVLIEPTFFIINHYWSLFDTGTQQLAKDLLLTMLKNSRQVLVGGMINKLPRLAQIPYLSDVESKLEALRRPMARRETFALFAERISHQNSGVVLLALHELVAYLKENQSFLQASAISEQPDSVIPTLMRGLLDCAAKYSVSQPDIGSLCTQCIGLVGCLDANRIEATRRQKSMAILTNLEAREEMTDFVLFILEEVLVKSFLSTTDTRLQGYLSFAMQELMDKIDIRAALEMEQQNIRDGERVYRKWLALPEGVREVLRPFLRSRYMLAQANLPSAEYPIFFRGKPYGNWMRSYVLNLLQKGQNPHAQLLFEPLTRVIRVKDISVAEFLLPYLVVHVVVGDEISEEERNNVTNELLNVLQNQPADHATYAEREDMKLYCEAVFRVLDYAMRWVQEKTRRRVAKSDEAAIERVRAMVDMIPPELRSQRAVDCNQYSRALFYLEHHAQEIELKEGDPTERTRLLERLQDIYAEIDEPDGLEGISARLHVLDINQQILSHKKAGRWPAAQTWYEIKLAEEPHNVDIQVDLLNCLKQSGQHDVLLNYVEGMQTEPMSENKIVPFAVEAAWATGRWESLSKYASRFQGNPLDDFNVGIAELFNAMRHGQHGGVGFKQTMQSLREKIASAMTYSATSSLQSSHELMLRCHVLTDMEIIADTVEAEGPAHQKVLDLLNRRLEVLGPYVNDKQYLLGVRRATMELCRFSNLDISSLWLASARLARKANAMHQSLNAVLHASRLGDDYAVIENARLLWKDGHPRKAIQVLQGAIDANKFATQVNSAVGSARGLDAEQRMLTARAQLTLAKWLDAAGQTHVVALRDKYQQVPKTLSAWEKGHFFLGRHYKKLMESEQSLKLDHQSDAYLQGEIARLVIENYLRSLSYGMKYLYQTLPRILTLWLDLGAQVDKPPEGKMSISRELQRRRVDQLGHLHKFLDKYIGKLPAYIFYTALPQIVARIAHPNEQVFERLGKIVVKVVNAHPRQALWGLFGVMTTKQASARRERGQRILQELRKSTVKSDKGSYDVKQLLRLGEKLAEQLLLACNNGSFQSNRTTTASIARDLYFNHKCTPCPLVVPIERCLSATLPTVTGNVRRHRAFSQDVITIESFLDEVLVLGSLARPRRLTARGSDGKNYMLLIKPKDDLRTDQRLMEFNGMINRALKRDGESSRRQLYIRTYAVTPLNEECGIIEWVDGLKTLRDILLEQYRVRGVAPDYNRIRRLMKEALVGRDNIHLFEREVLGTFPPVLHHWFVQQFPQPAEWFAARVKYTRSCAVMSMVGTMLGLGDRHGENVLLEKDNGGVFHVDFNCLFDKGRTFAEPEMVPFRLTHNMVAAMGIAGYEGPFRTCCELSVGVLRQQEETLMSVLEAFIYDPTLDLQKVKKTGRASAAAVVAPGEVRLEPAYVVESIKRKLRGLLPNESIPLGVEGYVDELIKQAVDPRNLSAMYIGWSTHSFGADLNPDTKPDTSSDASVSRALTNKRPILIESTRNSVKQTLKEAKIQTSYHALPQVSPSNRAVCQDSVCKHLKKTILKGELRFGSWIEFGDRGSFKWKHWGCVSGKQMQGLQEDAKRGDGFDFDAVDGYDEIGDYPEFQAKIRKAIELGHIPPEDFNGDPEFNVPGKLGIRSNQKVKQLKAGESTAEPEATPAKSKKRGRKAAAADNDDEEEDTKPKKRSKKAAAKVKDEGSSEEEVKPKAKARGKKAAAKVKDEDSSEEEAKPKAKARGKKAAAKVKDEDSSEEEVKPKAKARGKKAAAKVKDEDSSEEEVKPKAKTKAKKAAAKVKEEEPKSKKGRKVAAKVEEDESEAEEEEEAEPKPKTKGKGRKAVKTEEEDEEEAEPTPRGRKTQAKKRSQRRANLPPDVEAPMETTEDEIVEEDSDRDEPAPKPTTKKKAKAAKKAAGQADEGAAGGATEADDELPPEKAKLRRSRRRSGGA